MLSVAPRYSPQGLPLKVLVKQGVKITRGAPRGHSKPTSRAPAAGSGIHKAPTSPGLPLGAHIWVVPQRLSSGVPSSFTVLFWSMKSSRTLPGAVPTASPYPVPPGQE